MSITVALAGNPNSGKTTLFNTLTGSNQFVGNWPGVTVEKKEGKGKGDKSVTITDLPGIYSLSPYTLEEVVARNYLMNERPDAILNLVDGTNVERNLYLSTQLIEMGIPVVIAINMMDVVEKRGDKINIKQLSAELGCQVVTICALKGTGITQAVEMAIQSTKSGNTMTGTHKFSTCVEHAIAQIEKTMESKLPAVQPRWYAIKLFERDDNVQAQLKLDEATLTQLELITKKCEAELDDDAQSIVTNERYTYIASIINGCYQKKSHTSLTITDKIDRIVTNRWAAIPIFAAIMFSVYFVSVTTIGAYVTDFTNDVLFGTWITPAAASFLETIHTAPWLQGLLVDGIIGGVGAVLGFVPQMFVLFLFLAFLESCGYMSRIAFILDRIFKKFGLSGKSFIPMLIGTGCGVPGIMASRTVENDRDQKMTIMTTTFIPCGAKLPIIALIAGALFGGAWWVAPCAYFIGIAAVVLSGILLKKTRMFRGDPAPFVMELPAYHMPSISNVLRSMWERGWSFIKKAGTIILLSSLFIWFTSSFGVVDGKFGMVADLSQGFLANIGNAFAWVFTPLGFGTWQSGVATVMGLVAKENVVGTFGILFGFAEVAEGGKEIWSLLASHFTAISGFSFLVFNLLCAPCFAAIGAIKREMNSAKWTWFAIGYQTIFAYAVSLCVYQLGNLIFNGAFGVWTVIAFLTVAIFLCLLIRPTKKVHTQNN